MIELLFLGLQSFVLGYTFRGLLDAERRDAKTYGPRMSRRQRKEAEWAAWKARL